MVEPSQQSSERAEIQIQVFLRQAERRAQLDHSVPEAQERQTQALLLFLGQGARVETSDSLMLEDLAEELDQRQNQARQPHIDPLGVGVYPARKRAHQLVELVPQDEGFVAHGVANE